MSLGMLTRAGRLCLPLLGLPVWLSLSACDIGPSESNDGTTGDADDAGGGEPSQADAGEAEGGKSGDEDGEVAQICRTYCELDWYCFEYVSVEDCQQDCEDYYLLADNLGVPECRPALKAQDTCLGALDCEDLTEWLYGEIDDEEDYPCKAKDKAVADRCPGLDEIFVCDDGSQIDIDKLCDEEKDCPDGEDETHPVFCQL